MSRKLLCLVSLSLALLAGPAWAEQVVYFTNGTSMAIRGHESKAGMIHVDLGDNGFLAFPSYMVDRVEGAGKGVVLPPSSPESTNRVMNSRPAAGGSYPVRGHAPARQEIEINDAADSSASVYRPKANSPNRAKRMFGAIGRRNVTSQNANMPTSGLSRTPSATRVGNKVIAPNKVNDPRFGQTAAARKSMLGAKPVAPSKPAGKGSAN